MINIRVQFNIEGIEVYVFDGLDLDPILELEFISIFIKIKYLFIYIVIFKGFFLFLETDSCNIIKQGVPNRL